MPDKTFKYKFSTFIILVLFSISIFCQTGNKIEIVKADALKYDQNINPDLKRLIGNVVLKHNFTYMYCDSAYFYPDRNLFEAYSKVKILQGDSISLFCDFVNYDGNTDIAQARRNVKLIDRQMTLYTEMLDYNTNTSTGNYYHKGRIINNETLLTSHSGSYYGNSKAFFFKDSVEVTNPKYHILSDTLEYHPDNETVYFLGPTTILLDTNTIYCEYGWYKTKDSIAQFEKHAWIKNNSQILKGELLYYNQLTKIGKGRKHVVINDLKKEVVVCGNVVDFNRNTELFTSTDSAVLVMVTEGDSVYIHADTLKSEYDSINQNHILTAYYHVKFFKSDLQGKCDSLVYTTKDSIIKMFNAPVIWSAENQMTADYIETHIKNRAFDKIYLQVNSFISSREDSNKFNQIKGKSMIGYFKANQLYKIDVDGNGQTIYFPCEKESIIGINKVESSNLVLYVENRHIKRINFITKPSAKLTPLKQASVQDYLLKDFVWLNNYRPLDKDDIFRWE